MDAMKEMHIYDNTVIIIWGDHGWKLGEHNGWCKQTNFEIDTRVPMIFAGKGVKVKGKQSPALTEFVDIYPTLADLCGLSAPANLEGTSFKPLLNDPNLPWKKMAFTQVQRGVIAGRSIRTERWRYTEWDGGKQGVELYDHNTDPGEYYNLARETKHALTIAKLKRLLLQNMKQ